VKDRKSPKRLFSRQELLDTTHLSPQALKKHEEAGRVTAAEVSGGVKYYSEETVGIIKAMEQCLGRCANLQEAYQIALQGMALKKRRSSEADSSPLQFIDPREVKTHPRFKGLLSIDEDLAESLSADMTVEGYFLSQPVVLGRWPGQEDLVLIDGHTRVAAAIKAGVQKIPYSVETFDGIEGALEYIAKVQTHRRPTDDWVLYQLITELDCLMERGGDRKSEQAKSKGPDGPLETRHATSAERTAALVGCSGRTVKRARRIRKDGTAEILEALKNREMTINQAEQAVASKDKTHHKTETEPSFVESENCLVQVNDEYRGVLSQVEGTLHEHVNKAVKMYIRWLRDKGRLPEKKGTQ
jgi:hypothetical protein